MSKYKLKINRWCKLEEIIITGDSKIDALIKWCNNYMSVAHTEILSLCKEENNRIIEKGDSTE